MTWISPLTGVLVAAAVIPPLLLLYFLRLRRQEASIASTLLWEHAVEDLRANAPFQRLRPSLLLFLQILVLLLLAAAIMQPQLAGAERTEGRIILLVDRSASMNATDGPDGSTRLEHARELARGRIEALYAGGLFGRSEVETMIIAFADEGEIITRFTRSRDELLRALDRITPTDGRSRFAGALQLARAYMTNTDPESNRPQGEPATLELFSDGRIADLAELGYRQEQIVYHRLGAPGGSNVAVQQVTAARPFDRPEAVEVFASVISHDREPVVTDIALRVDDRVVAVQEITVPAGSDGPGGQRDPGRASVVFSPFPQPEGAVVSVSLERKDLLAVDDTARAVLPPPKSLDVLVVGDGSGLVIDVLEGMPLRRLRQMTPAEWDARIESGADLEVDVIVGDGWAPAEGRMPRGRYLIFGPIPPINGLESFGTAEGQLVIRTDREHPVLRSAVLDDLVVAEATLVQPDRTATVLVDGERGPLVLESRRDGRHVIAVTFDPRDSNFPLLRSWVTFTFNAIEHLGRSGGDAADAMLVPGDAISARLPAGASEIQVRRPNGEVQSVPALDPARFSWGPVQRLGLYTVSWRAPGSPPDGGDGIRQFAVNLGDESEADIEPVESVRLGTRTVSGVEAADSGYRPIWPWAIGAALAVLMIEWFAWTRKTGT